MLPLYDLLRRTDSGKTNTLSSKERETGNASDTTTWLLVPGDENSQPKCKPGILGKVGLAVLPRDKPTSLTSLTSLKSQSTFGKTAPSLVGRSAMKRNSIFVIVYESEDRGHSSA